MEILGGTPVFVGTRVPVKSLYDHLEAGDSLDMTMHLLYAAWRAPQGWLRPWAESDAPGKPNQRAN